MHTVLTYLWESGPIKYLKKVPLCIPYLLTYGKGNVLPEYVSKYLWESGPLKYRQKVELGSKISYFWACEYL